MNNATQALEKAADDCADGGWDARERRLVTLTDAKKIVAALESKLDRLREIVGLVESDHITADEAHERLVNEFGDFGFTYGEPPK